MVALLLALVATMTPFVADPDRAYAQAPTGLASLSVGGKQIAIAPDGVADYTHNEAADIIRVSSGTDTVNVSATQRISTHIVEIRYGTADSLGTGGAGANLLTAGTVVTTRSVPLVAGSNTDIAITVKESNADTVTTGDIYVVRVRRVPSVITDGAVADLSNLAITTPVVALKPSFGRDKTSYTAFVPYDVDDTGNDATDEVTVTTALAGPTSGDDQASLEVKSNKGADKVNTTTANTTHTVTLDEGENVITVMVMAADAATTKRYTLTVTRARFTASDNANLSSLTVDGESVKLFDASDTVVGYTARVTNGTSSIEVVGYAGALRRRGRPNF